MWSARRSGRRSAAILASVAILACSESRTVTSPVSDVTREELLQALTPEAALSVRTDGRLQLSPPLNTGRAQISGTQAGKLAVAAAKFNFPYGSTYFNGQHGSPIAYQKLSVCGDPLYVTSPFERLEIDDPSTVAHPVQKELGPSWLVKLCGPAGDAQMNVVIAAYSTALSIMSNGEIDFPPIGGADIAAEGIPTDRPGDELPSAEAAVVVASKLTGRRVTAPPILVAPFYLKEGSPLIARWQVSLDGAAQLPVAAGAAQVSKVYVSAVRDYQKPPSRNWVAAATQPATVQVTYYPMAVVGENYDAYQARRAVGTRILDAVRRPDMPIVFAPIMTSR